MLKGHNVVWLVREKKILFMDQAVFTPIPGTCDDGKPEYPREPSH